MDFVNKLSGKGSDSKSEGSDSKKEGGGMLSGVTDKLNSAAGGGKESEKKEDYVDKGVDYVQEHVMGQGKQDNESAIEQAKDDKIAGFVRDQYKSKTGSDFPGSKK